MNTTPQLLRAAADNHHRKSERLELELTNILSDCQDYANQGFYAHLCTFKLHLQYEKTEIDYFVRRLQDMGFGLEMSYDADKEEVDLKIEW